MPLTFIYAKTLFESSIFNWFYLYSPIFSLHYWYLVMNNITWYVFKRALRDLLKFFKNISLLYSTIPIIFILKFTFTVYEKISNNASIKIMIYIFYNTLYTKYSRWHNYVMGHYPFRPGHSRYSIFKEAINLFYYAKNDILDEKYILLEDYTTCNIFYFSTIRKFANVKLSGFFFSLFFNCKLI